MGNSKEFDLNDKIRVKVDIIRFSSTVATESHQELCDLIMGVASSDDCRLLGIRAHRLALETVDSLMRCLRVLVSMPGASRKQPAIREALDLIGRIKNARDHLQHVDGKAVAKEGSYEFPAIGVVAWSRGGLLKSWCLSLGYHASKTEIFTLSYDTVEGKFEDGLFYFVAGEKLNLSSATECVRRAVDSYIEILKLKFGEFIHALEPMGIEVSADSISDKLESTGIEVTSDSISENFPIQRYVSVNIRID